MSLPTLKRWLQVDVMKRPVLLVIMDGVGLYRGQAEGYDGNALDQAQKRISDTVRL